MNQLSVILKYSIEGYNNGQLEKALVLRGVASKTNGDLFRGRSLDRISITCNLFTQSDCDDLINFLKAQKYCLPEQITNL